MRVTLIYPGYSLEEEFGKLKDIAPRCMPLGIASVAAVLENEGHDVSCIDTTISCTKPNELKNRLSKENPDVIGLSILTPMFDTIKKKLKIIREVCPDVPLIGGGPHVMFYPESIFKHFPELDVAVDGEGEYTMLNLLNELKKKSPNLKNVNGLVLHNNGNIVCTKTEDYIKDLDELPMPARHLFPVKEYRPSVMRYKQLPSLTMFTSRGCPYRCAFCHQTFGKMVRTRSAKKVFEEMMVCNEQFGTKDFEFHDNSIACNRERLKELCRMLIKEKCDFTWTGQLRVNEVDRELLWYMKKAGCWSLRFGIESGVQRLLDYITKDITLKQTGKVIELCNEIGIITYGAFIIGLPTETQQETRKTINFAKELPLHYAHFSIYTPRPKTRLYELAKADGFDVEDSAYENFWSGIVGHLPNYAPSGRDVEELAKWQKKAFREFYLRPGVIKQHLKEIKGPRDFINKVRGFRVLFYH